MEHFEELNDHIKQRKGLLKASDHLNLRFVGSNVDNFHYKHRSDSMNLHEISSLIGHSRMKECVKVFQDMIQNKIYESLKNNEQNLEEFKIIKTDK